MNKLQVLAKYLDCEPGELKPSEWQTFEFGDREYKVLTDEEADSQAKAYIKESLWAFRASFICKYMDSWRVLDGGTADAFEELIKNAQEKLCESANPIISSLVGENIDNLIKYAIECDGRGHFIAQYDFEEIEADSSSGLIEYYIYRVN